MLLARNPSLHPGDIRVVRGVDVPSLHHLRDAVVLPQTGDRDIPSMCSGGDLDGDDFLVMWDTTLLPKEWNCEPMNYSAPPPLTVEKKVNLDDIKSFFVKYMKNDALPTIAHAHVAQADFLDKGVKDDRCNVVDISSLYNELNIVRSRTCSFAFHGRRLCQNWYPCLDVKRASSSEMASLHGEKEQAKRSAVRFKKNPWPAL